MSGKHRKYTPEFREQIFSDACFETHLAAPLTFSRRPRLTRWGGALSAEAFPPSAACSSLTSRAYGCFAGPAIKDLKSIL
jgi:hypothetical protein